MAKKFVKVLVFVLVGVLLLGTLVGCGSTPEEKEQKLAAKNEKYTDWEVIAVTASTYYVSSFGTRTCFVVTCIDDNNVVHTVDLDDFDVKIISSGDPYIAYEHTEGYPKLFITDEDLRNYLN
jgi:hypothetical protein